MSSFDPDRRPSRRYGLSAPRADPPPMSRRFNLGNAQEREHPGAKCGRADSGMGCSLWAPALRSDAASPDEH